MGLKEYQAKRNFSRTREPAGKPARRKTAPSRAMFVIQKHAASRLHYDFRLEAEGVLKSWAIPKGLPVKKGERRLAVQVEDHPIEYGGFEGTIPPGNYGSGTVMIWDAGSYECREDDAAKAIAQGKVHLTLRGKKLKGEWTLVRMRHWGGEKAQWLIMKSGEDSKPVSAQAETHSALSRRTMEQIAAENNRQWKSSRVKTPSTEKPAPKSSSRETRIQAPSKLPARKPSFIEPMKCVLSATLPQGEDWIYEIKFDGYRAIAVKNEKSVALISRNKNDFTPRYPEVAEAVARLSCQSAVLDGELVALDPEGRSSFQLLQAYATAGGAKPPLFYFVFDIAQLDGKDLTGLPLAQRKKILERLMAGAPHSLLFSGSIEAEGERVLAAMKARGLEGLIAKQRDSRYESGRRSGKWVKFKWTNEQEFVIGGYTPPDGTRPHFGAVLVGCYEKGKLLYASKVGTGFNTKSLSNLHKCFQRYLQTDCPFANLPEKTPGRWGQGMTASKMKTCRWLRPELVCQVRFSEWTRDGHLRQPVFLGLREDKEPREVVREKPKKPDSRRSG